MPQGEKGAESPGRTHRAGDGSEYGEPGEGERRGKTRFRNIEERFLEPNSLKKKKKILGLVGSRETFLYLGLARGSTN